MTALSDLKERIKPFFRAYMSPWKLSFFGHNHDERANAVLQAILQATNICQINRILQNQKDLFDCGQSSVSVNTLLPAKFSQQLRNVPTNFSSSGFYRALIVAREEVKLVAPGLVAAEPHGAFNAVLFR